MNIADAWYNWRVKRNLYAIRRHWTVMRIYEEETQSTNPRIAKKYEGICSRASSAVTFILYRLENKYGIKADTHYILSDGTEFRIMKEEQDVVVYDYTSR